MIPAPPPGPSTEKTPYDLLGGEAPVRAIVKHFYDEMDANEPELAATHKCDEHGRVSQESRERFALFLIGWLGGPQDYMVLHGHPRLRMRHARVPVDSTMRDAWTRSMKLAMDAAKIDGPVRAFLETRFAELADFLRNTPDGAASGDGRS